MWTKKIFWIFLPLLGMLSSCEEEIDFDKLQAEEDRYFQIYIDANYPDLVPDENGLYFIEEKIGTGALPDTGDYVLVNYVAYTVPDEEVVDTYVEEWAQDHGLYNSSVMYGPYKYEHGSEIEGMKMGISRMKEGGIARMIFQSDLGYGNSGLANIGRFQSLMYDVELLEVIKNPEADEQGKIDDYLREVSSSIPIYDSETDATMYYIIDQEGDSTFVKEGDRIEVKYTGQLLDGRIFDATEDDNAFEVTVGEGEVIAGWDIGLKYFRYGGKGRLLIPHELAYGENGSFVSGNKVSIPPYEALLFEMEVLKTEIPE